MGRIISNHSALQEQEQQEQAEIVSFHNRVRPTGADLAANVWQVVCAPVLHAIDVTWQYLFGGTPEQTEAIVNGVEASYKDSNGQQ